MPRLATLAAAQIAPKPGDVRANLERIALWTERAAAAQADLVCFPEVCTTGSSSAPVSASAEPIPGPTTERLSSLAAQHRLWLIVGMIEANAAGKPYNSAVVLDPSGRVAAVYHKAYLFSGEREAFTPGDRPCLLDLPFGRAGLTICYDFMFPGYIAGLVDRGAELIIHATNWLTTDSWVRLGYDQQEYRAVGIARAVENTCWFLSANRYGPCDASAVYSSIGHSALIAPWGRVIAEVPDGEGLALAQVDFDATTTWRQQVAQYLEDRRRIDPWQ